MTSNHTSKHNRGNVTESDQINPHVHRELIVKLKTEFAADPDVRRRIIESLPKESVVARDFDDLGLGVIELPLGTDPLSVAAAVQADKAVEYAEPNFTDSGTV